MSGQNLKLSGYDIGVIMSAYLSEKPKKEDVYPTIMLMLDYCADDHSENELSIKDYFTDALRKRAMLEDLLKKWRKN